MTQLEGAANSAMWAAEFSLRNVEKQFFLKKC